MHRIAAFSLATILAATGFVSAQSEPVSLFRQPLSAPILFSGGSSTPPPIDPNFPGDPVLSVLSLSPSLQAYATAGETYYYGTVSATGGSAATVTFSPDGDWPLGLELTGDVLSGTFAAADTYDPFYIRGSDGSFLGPLNVPVENPLNQADFPASWSIPTGQKSFLDIPDTTGGLGPYTYTFEAPAGFAGSVEVHEATGRVSITAPSAGGAYGQFTLTAKDVRNRSDHTVVDVTGLVPFSLTGVQSNYSLVEGETLVIDAALVGGTGTYTTALKPGSGAFPSGVTITDSSGGVVSGMTDVAGNYTFTLVFGDGTTNIERPVSVVIAPPLMPSHVNTSRYSSGGGLSAPPGTQVGDLLIVAVQQLSTTGVPTLSGTGFEAPVRMATGRGFAIYRTRLTNLTHTFTAAPSVAGNSINVGISAFRNAGLPVVDTVGQLATTTAGVEFHNSKPGAGFRAIFLGRSNPGLDLRFDRYTFSDPQGNFPNGVTEAYDSGTLSSGSTVGIAAAYGARAMTVKPGTPMVVIKSVGNDWISYVAGLIIPYAAQ